MGCARPATITVRSGQLPDLTTPNPAGPGEEALALAALPAAARARRIRVRADAGYFAGQLARTALVAEVDSPSVPGGSRRCGDCSTVCPRRRGPTRST